MSAGEARIVAFVDIRGFTRLSEEPAAQPLLPSLLFELYVDLSALLPRHGLEADGAAFVKPLGDGALLLMGGAEAPDATLPRILALVCEVELRFQERLQRVNGARGTGLQAQLGWGIARGAVVPVRVPPQRLEPAFTDEQAAFARGLRGHAVLDYFGPTLNRAKRICDRARPSGVCIDAEAFAARPEHAGFAFSPRTLKDVRGIAETLTVWFSRCEPGRAGTAPPAG